MGICLRVCVCMRPHSVIGCHTVFNTVQIAFSQGSHTSEAGPWGGCGRVPSPAFCVELPRHGHHAIAIAVVAAAVVVIVAVVVVPVSGFWAWHVR